MVLRCLFFLTLLWVGIPAYGFPVYYELYQAKEAQKEASERNLPLAWLGGYPDDIAHPPPGFTERTTFEQMILAALKDRAVIIFFDSVKVPELVTRQFHVRDDGVLKGEYLWIAPKVVFTDPGVTESWGRVSCTQMRRDGHLALDAALETIQKENRLVEKKVPAVETSVPTKSNKEGEVVGSISNAVDFIDLVAQYRLTIIATGLLAAVAFGGFIWWTRSK